MDYGALGIEFSRLVPWPIAIAILGLGEALGAAA